MALFLKAAGWGGGILVLIALLITLLKQLIAIIGFISAAIKLIVLLVFLALIFGVGFIMLRAWNESRRKARAE